MTVRNSLNSQWGRVWLPIVIVLGAIGLVFGMVSMRPPSEKKAAEATVMTVNILPVERASVDFKIASQGTVRPRTETTLMAEVSGKVEWVSPQFVAGGFFRSGDALLRIDPSDYEVALMRAEASLAGRQAQLAKEEAQAEQAKKDWQHLQRQGSASALVLREPQMAEARANVQAARADVEKARRDLTRTRIRAPYDGLVKSKDADIGQYVSLGSQLGVSFAIDRVEVRLPLSSEDLAYLDLPLLQADGDAVHPAVSLSARLAGKQQRWQAEIVRTEGTFDERSRVIYAVAQVQDPYGVLGTVEQPILPVGTFVEADISGLRVDNVIALPRHTVRNLETVLLADDNDLLEVRKVSVVRRDAEHVYVSDGLANGARVITTSIEVPIPGMRLQINEVARSPSKAAEEADTVLAQRPPTTAGVR